jgi:hypothetical protein
MSPEAIAGAGKPLDRIVSMLTRFGQRGYTFGERPAD